MGLEVPYLLVGCKSDLRQPGQTLQQVKTWPLRAILWMYQKSSCLRHEQHPALLTCLSALFQDATNAVYQVHALCTAQCIAE